MSVFYENMLIGSSGQGGAAAGYQVSRSLRFNSADSAYLNRTPASAGNRKTWTWSGWVKRTKIGAGINSSFFRAAAAGQIWFKAGFQDDTISVSVVAGGAEGPKTSAVFRDTSAWYHIVIAFDTTQATAANRQKLYVNGVQVSFTTDLVWPNQNQDYQVNNTVIHYISDPAGGEYFDGYLADVWFVDGSALTPSDFAETDATTGQWIPKAYTGSKGTNGFHLEFADNSNNTASTLGKDTSGNSNNWTPNNFYVSNTVYSSGVSITGSYANNTNARMAFDGSTSTILEMSGSNNQITFTPPAAISFSSTVEVFLTPTGNVTYTRYSFNGGADTSFAAGDGWKTVASGGGTFTSLVLKQGAQSNNIGFAAIRINGSTILVDASSVDNDSLVDTPTSYGTDTGAGGEVRGNYATFNPLYKTSAGAALSNGNLNYTTAGSSGNSAMPGTIAVSSGKWYWEITPTSIGSGVSIGVAYASEQTTDYPGYPATSWAYRSDGNKINNASATSYGASYTTNDVIGVALNLDAGTLVFYKNGTSQGTAYSSLSGTFVAKVGDIGSQASMVANFGQRAFAYTAPSGFKALCDTNLPAPVVAKPSTVMDVKLYSGTSSNQTISGLNLSPDMVWIKERNGTSWHRIMDIVRGAGKEIFTNATNAEASYSQGLNSFTSDGFTLGTGSDSNVNTSGYTYAAWCWDAGSSTVTNTQGSITSQVRANTSAGFSVVTWTGTGSGTYTVGHGLGVAPSFIITKFRSAASNWDCYHASLGNAYVISLNTTGASLNRPNRWNSTSPTSTVFSIGTDINDAQNLVAYCFAPVAGYSSFGSYTGNGSTDGPFVFTGHRSRWVMVKRTDTTGNWVIVDTARDTYNYVNSAMYADSSQSESSVGAGPYIDCLSNGFKVRTSTYGNWNANGGTYIYCSFAESPFQYARAR